MSIDRCIHCETHIDTDYNAECYRSEFDDSCICDNCFENSYTCPECGSGETFMAHHEATGATPEATSKNCHECGHQWDIE